MTGFGEWVLIEPEPEQERKVGGVLLPKGIRLGGTITGKIVAHRLVILPVPLIENLPPGTKVVFNLIDAVPYEHDDNKKYYFVKKEHILGVL